MRITQASVHPYEAPLARPYVSATARHETRRGLILRLVTEDSEGLGEAAPLSNRTESLDEAQRALRSTARTLEADPPEPSELLENLDGTLPALADAPTARFAVELALLDLLARQADQPLAGWIAARSDRQAREPAERVPVNATIPVCDPDETAERAQKAVQAAFSTIKLKGSGGASRDSDRVRAAREAGGSDLNLRLDVNGAWPDLATARERVDELAPHDLEYVEQPLPPDAIDEMARLREVSPIPIAADEPVLDLDSAQRILDAGAADVLVCKPMVLGGPLATLEIARAARAHDVPVVVTSTIDGAIGRAGALHTAAALDALPHACGLATGELIQREPAAFDERVEQGELLVPEAPGHGAWIAGPLEALG